MMGGGGDMVEDDEGGGGGGRGSRICGGLRGGFFPDIRGGMEGPDGVKCSSGGASYTS